MTHNELTAKIIYQALSTGTGDAWIVSYEAGVRSTYLIKRADEMIDAGRNVRIIHNDLAYTVEEWKMFVAQLPAKVGA